jgi:metallo-beta-lactamase family protein
MIESTYGDRVHEAPPDYAIALAEVLQRTFDRGGSVIVPSFAVGRTQEMLYFLRRIKTENLVHGHDGFPVFVDSPLANAATRIYVENEDFCYDEEAKAFVEAGINPLAFDGLTIAETTEDSKAINFDKRSKVILSASGMCTAGRIKHHLKHGLWNANNTILFVGFQAYGTLGRALIEGAEKVKLFGETIRVNAEIKQLPGISGHGDSNLLIKWATHFAPKPRRVFVNHGESAVCDLFTDRLKTEFGLPATSPYSGSVYDLIANAYVVEKRPVEIHEGAKPAEAEKVSPYGKLLNALERLTKLIKGSKGRSNREIRSVTSQLEAISDAWERE